MEKIKMTDEELSKELADAVANQDKMKHVETKATQSEVALKLKCQACDEIIDFPECDEHQQYELSEDGMTMTCPVDGKSMDTPKHHDKPMVPFVVRA